jgi:SnoaL-like domain
LVISACRRPRLARSATARPGIHTAIDAGDEETWASTFTPDGAFNNNVTGRDALVKFVRDWRERKAVMIRAVLAPQSPFSITAPRAVSRTCVKAAASD